MLDALLVHHASLEKNEVCKGEDGEVERKQGGGGGLSYDGTRVT